MEQNRLESGLGLVRAYARRFAGRHPAAAHEDLISDGNLALTLAITSYDPSRGVSWPGFASSRIRWAMRDGIRSRGRHCHPSIEDPVSVHHDWTIGDTLRAAAGGRHISADRLEAAIARLEPRRRRMITGHYYEGLDWAELAEELHRSLATAYRLRNSALRRLRRHLRASEPASDLVRLVR